MIREGKDGYWIAEGPDEGSAWFEWQSKGKNGHYYSRWDEQLSDVADRLNRYEALLRALTSFNYYESEFIDATEKTRHELEVLEPPGGMPE